jgi:hypothetical protein
MDAGSYSEAIVDVVARHSEKFYIRAVKFPKFGWGKFCPYNLLKVKYNLLMLVCGKKSAL